MNALQHITTTSLDVAAACREVSTMAAILLVRSDGDVEAALALAAELEAIPASEPQDGELDSLRIAAQAIRDARTYLNGGSV